MNAIQAAEISEKNKITNSDSYRLIKEKIAEAAGDGKREITIVTRIATTPICKFLEKEEYYKFSYANENMESLNGQVRITW